MAPPIEGTCEVVSPPTILAMLLPLRREMGLEVFDAHAGLLGADILHVEAEDAGEFREVVDIAADADELQHVAAADRRLLRLAEAIAGHVALLVREERLPVLRGIKGEAHLVQRVADPRVVTLENRGSGNSLQIVHGACLRPAG